MRCAVYAYRGKAQAILGGETFHFVGYIRSTLDQLTDYKSETNLMRPG